MATNPAQDVPERLSQYELALRAESLCRNTERMLREGSICRCSNYSNQPCPHRGQLELLDTETTLSHVRWGLRSDAWTGRYGPAVGGGWQRTMYQSTFPQPGSRFGRQRSSRPSWVAELLPRPYATYPVYECSFANRQRG